jgi:sugar/nucleoside kinase (ribokinase family)
MKFLISLKFEMWTFFVKAGQDIQEFQVKKPLDIVDTNGAGDSFVGGLFL